MDGFWYEVKAWLREHALVVVLAVVALIGVGFGGFQLYEHFVVAPAEEAAAVALEPEEAAMPESAAPEQATEAAAMDQYVDVKGAVAHPDVYKIEAGERVHDVIARAGGLLDEADRTRVNFSEKLVDQMVVYVPAVGEDIPAEWQHSGGVAASGVPSSEQKVNLNTATKEELMTLSGIGEKRATDIISYRETNGNFQAVDDLINVSGIGPKTLEKLRDQLAV